MTGRFAPSPSGRMHLGNVFSALMAWCSVRKQNGTMLLRIEDLDPDRCRTEYAEQLKKDLLWLGLDWDTESAPQSQRSAVYAEYFDRLGDLVYPCYCTRNELHDASAPHGTDGQPIYAGTCRDLTDAERAERTRRPAWRVRVPDETVCFTDGVFGEVSENLARDCGDFILRRSDGVYAYQLAVVADDGESGVTEIVRGCDLLSSTPRQLWLQRQFGFAAPHYYHVPLLIAPDGRRLSKRDRDLDLGALQLRFSAEELIGKLAFAAGLTETEEAISAKELSEIFDWKYIKKEPIVIERFI